MSADTADLIKSCLRETPARMKLPFGFLVLWPAAAADLAVAIERDETDTLRDLWSGDTDIGNEVFLEAMRDDEAVRGAFLILALACARSRLAKLMVVMAFVRPIIFVEVALTALVLTAPRDVTTLFPKPKKTTEEPDENVEALPLWILRNVSKLRGAGHDDADRMSLTRLSYHAVIAGQTQKESLRIAALAARLGQTTDKKYREFEKVAS